MKKTEIKKLDDKDLQLRYYLGGLKLICDGENQLCDYWTCNINCSCSDVPDDERIVEVKKFINKHNITNERFIKLSYWFLVGSVMKYKGAYSPLFVELDKVIEPFQFTHTKNGEIPDSSFREKTLENIANEPIVKEYCSKYQLDIEDFIVLAKMSLNYHFYKLQVAKNPNDTFSDELYNIIKSHNLYVPREYIKEYREKYKDNQETIQLWNDTKEAQKNYLKLLKELLAKDSTLATELISEELSEIDFKSKEDIQKLILQK